ncbi:MAG: hypothetical protein JO276_15305 [Sphingomonadaceae bacterium]|nr:hypothetical protein [Sphingomonadaceae bacterium]
MRSLIAAALILAPAALAAQDSTPPGTDVERIGLQPGESASFTLASGNEHQLLHRSAANARGAITISYRVEGGQSTISAVSHTGYPTSFSVLADPDGNGGFEPEGSIALPGDGQAVTRTWPSPLGAINVGHFVGGPGGMNRQ